MICDVFCRGCGESFHHTNDKFDYEKDPHGERMTADMFVLKNPWKDEYNWQDFPKDSWYTGNSLVCPGCETPYPDAEGKIRVVPSSWDCSVCGKSYKAKGYLDRHIEREHPDG